LRLKNNLFLKKFRKD
jgi:hypothetical protein